MKILLALLLFATTAQAIDVKVYVYSTSGKNGLKEAEARELFDAVAARVRNELGINLVLWKFLRRPDRFKNYACLSNYCRLKRLHKWQAFFKKRVPRNDVVKLVLLPPIYESGKFWLAGYASGTCTYKRLTTVAYSHGELFNQDGLDRWMHSINAMLHELLHILGAYHHDEELNVMHSNALYYVTPAGGVLPILQSTVQEVAACLD